MQPPFRLTEKMFQLVVQITEQTTRLQLAEQQAFRLRKASRIRSIHSSLAIEQNQLSQEKVTAILEGKRVLGAPKEIREVQNAYEAYERAFTLNPYSIEDFLTAHGLLMKDLVQQVGMFRTQDVGVYDEQGQVIHVGARPNYIYPLVTDLFQWAEQSDLPDLIKSCVVHFEIEMIHPFADGNGRMGRLWQNLILAKWQPIYEWLPIETLIYEHQDSYYEYMAQGEYENDSSAFIEFMLEMILATIQSLHPPISNEKNLSLTRSEQHFYQALRANLSRQESFSVQEVLPYSDKSISTIRRYLAKFVQLGLLKASGQNKNRRYLW